MTKRYVQIMAVTALAFGLAACGKNDDSQTAGQKLDSAISQTKDAADTAGKKLEEGAAQAGGAAANALDKAGEKLNSAADSASSKIEEGAAKAGQALDDVGITAQIKADLIKAPEVSALKVEVETKSGVVTLSGTVPSDSVKNRAGEIAKGVKGVASVNNNLTIQAN
jgi:osmotically-inducible protein OsmY